MFQKSLLVFLLVAVCACQASLTVIVDDENLDLLSLYRKAEVVCREVPQCILLDATTKTTARYSQKIVPGCLLQFLPPGRHEDLFPSSISWPQECCRKTPNSSEGIAMIVSCLLLASFLRFFWPEVTKEPTESEESSSALEEDSDEDSSDYSFSSSEEEDFEEEIKIVEKDIIAMKIRMKELDQEIATIQRLLQEE